MSDFYHKSVLLKETIEYLSIKAGSKYIDATLGGGGHAQEILEKGGVVLGIDVDEDSIHFTKKKLIGKENLTIAWGNFKDIDEIAKNNGFEKVAGVVMDLGVSSHQIDDKARGFSYLGETALDMRMDKRQRLKAADLLNILPKKELYEIFIKYGQEPHALAIANGVIESRRVKAFEKASDLTDIVEKAYGLRGEVNMKLKAKVNTRVFQALRMAVNDELNSLEQALPRAVLLLKKGGRVVVISFHSLEDKVVKKTFTDMEASGVGKIITKKPIVPAYVETIENRRSRSAKMRVFERI